MVTTIIDRYVFRQAAGAVLLILLSLSGVVWIAIALRQLNVVTSQGQDVWILIQMTTLALPNLIAIIAPFALLIAALHTLNRLNSDSELIVLTASGANVWTISRPLIVLSIIVSLGVAYVNHQAMPWSLRQLRQYIVAVRTDLLTQVIQPGRFTSPEPGLTFHIRERSFDGELRGLIMHDTRDPKQAASFLAERGEIVKQGEGAYLVMSTGHIVRRPDPAEGGQVIAFDRYTIDLEQFESKVAESSDLRPRERYYDELVNPGDSSAFKAEPGKFRSELHDRLSSPLYPLAFVMIALATIGRAQSTRQNRTQWMVIGFVAGAGTRLAGLAVSNLVTTSAAFVPVLYAIPVGAAAISLAALVVPGIAIRRPARPVSSSTAVAGSAR
ncbi:MAG: LPS export ABC transporter permease LptF [Hyphomicrobiaceae bacterium]|nr:LPS export ABC transporter permease LptF [Hyphomicrobiaceae bacterium]